MSALRRHVIDYLAMRRSLGFKLTFPGQVLPDLADYLQAAGVATVTTELAIAWAGLPQGRVQPIMLAHRLGAVRGFARWLVTIDPATEVPPAGIWPSTAPRPVPYLWSAADIAALLDPDVVVAAAGGHPRNAVRSARRERDAYRRSPRSRGQRHRFDRRCDHNSPGQVQPGTAGAAACHDHGRAASLGDGA